MFTEQWIMRAVQYICQSFWFVAEASQFYGLTDLHKVIQVIQDNPTLSMYLTPAVSKASVRYHYYNLKYESVLLKKLL